MTGWKTWTAAGLSILWGIIGLALDVHGADEAANLIIQGLAIAGFGHKIQKAGES